MGREVLTYTRIGPEVRNPKRMDITGTHYELGHLMGHIARQHGHPPPRLYDQQRSLNGQIIEMYRRVYPQYLELVRGVADAFETPLEELSFASLENSFFLDLWGSVFRYGRFDALQIGPADWPAGRNCAVVSAGLDRPPPILGRNFDNAYERPHFIVYTDLEGVYRVMANAQYALYHWVMDAMNEKGLFMATANNASPPEYMFTDPYPDVPAIQEHHLFRVALETCASVDEVIALYGSVRPWSQQADHLLVADAEGNSAVIEFDLERRTRIFRAQADYQVLTNTAYSMGLDYVLSHCNRFREATERAEEGIDDLEEMAQVMASIRGPAGYLSLFDSRRRLMRLHLRRDFETAWDFTLPW
jgi:predicted choloylglycine hydrolase